eukprot:5024421-Amphidinium_carterae.1
MQESIAFGEEGERGVLLLTAAAAGLDPCESAPDDAGERVTAAQLTPLHDAGCSRQVCTGHLKILQALVGHCEIAKSDRHLDVLLAIVSLLDLQRLLQKIAIFLMIAKVAIGVPQGVKIDRHLEVLVAV